MEQLLSTQPDVLAPEMAVYGDLIDEVTEGLNLEELAEAEEAFDQWNFAKLEKVFGGAR